MDWVKWLAVGILIAMFISNLMPSVILFIEEKRRQKKPKDGDDDG